MPVYNGNSKAKDLYYGGTKIKEAYYGSIKVYNSGPLYYCYRLLDRGVYKYMYLSQKPTGPCTITAHYKSSSDNSQVSSSSQLTYSANWTVTSATDSSFVITASGKSATWDYYQSGNLYTQKGE